MIGETPDLELLEALARRLDDDRELDAETAALVTDLACDSPLLVVLARYVDATRLVH